MKESPKIAAKQLESARELANRFGMCQLPERFQRSNKSLARLKFWGK
jgi:ribosomal protein L16/L10AE